MQAVENKGDLFDLRAKVDKLIKTPYDEKELSEDGVLKQTEDLISEIQAFDSKSFGEKIWDNKLMTKISNIITIDNEKAQEVVAMYAKNYGLFQAEAEKVKQLAILTQHQVKLTSNETKRANEESNKRKRAEEELDTAEKATQFQNELTDIYSVSDETEKEARFKQYLDTKVTDIIDAKAVLKALETMSKNIFLKVVADKVEGILNKDENKELKGKYDEAAVALLPNKRPKIADNTGQPHRAPRGAVSLAVERTATKGPT